MLAHTFVAMLLLPSTAWNVATKARPAIRASMMSPHVTDVPPSTSRVCTKTNDNE
jgi:hypothetical protein